MVSNQMDMLERADAQPQSVTEDIEVDARARRKIALIQEIAENGEAIINLRNGYSTEVHADDTHFYVDIGVFFTEDDDPEGEEAESWYFAEDIISVQRH
jgi:hypothetical protein